MPSNEAFANPSFDGFIQRIFHSFSANFRGKKVKEFNGKFWDLIAITTIDEDQKKSTEFQIDIKIKSKELPTDVPIHVISDPKGPKIGNGGSTLYALNHLFKIYGFQLYSKKILLINAGGFSKRLPTLSIIGKLFQSFPLGDLNFGALEVIICMHLPFITRMRSGVFVVCPDALIPFNLEECDDWTFEKEGITAISHPSAVEIGQNHGVYVLCDKPTELQLSKTAYMANCSKVLQKPSMKIMYDKGAVQKNAKGEEFIYSDSCFFMSSEVIVKLLDFYQKEEPLECEIDAFGDFLPAMGQNSDNSHTKESKNVTLKHPKLQEMRQKVYDCLHSTPLNLLVLNKSKFYHIGSIKELLYNFCQDSKLRSEFGFKSISSSLVSGDSNSNGIKGVLINSIVNGSCKIGDSVLVEYSDIQSPIIAEKNCLISNCVIRNTPDEPFTLLPNNSLFHTIPILENGSTSFVTVCFEYDANLKREYHEDNLNEFKYFGVNMVEIAKSFSSNGRSFFNDRKYSLWNARLFTSSPNMMESFQTTLKRVQSIVAEDCCHKPTISYSMNDILSAKDYRSLIEFRFSLRESFDYLSNKS